MNKFLSRIIWPVMIAPAAYLVSTWKKIPENVAMHFDINGNADRFGSKSELLTTTIILSAVNVVIYLLLTNVYRIDPKKYAAENKSRLYRIGFAVSVFMAGITCMIVYNAANGGTRFDVKMVLAGVGLLFAIIGNYLPNMKPNYFAGLRLPWTLENPDNWKKTHALAGKLWFSGGLLLAIVCLLLTPAASFIIFIVVTLIITLIPAIFSYRYYKQGKKKNI